MSDLKEMLRKCSAGDMEYISDVLDNYVAFTDDSKRKKLLDKARVNWGGLIGRN